MTASGHTRLCSAAPIAYLAIRAQRDIARRRAAIDFFFKTELDKDAIALYNNFKKVDVLKLTNVPMAERKISKDYEDARSFLNVCELIAVGIHNDAFSENVSLAYWGDVLPAAYKRMEPLIKEIRQTEGEGSSETYADLQTLCEKWPSNNIEITRNEYNARSLLIAARQYLTVATAGSALGVIAAAQAIHHFTNWEANIAITIATLIVAATIHILLSFQNSAFSDEGSLAQPANAPSFHNYLVLSILIGLTMVSAVVVTYPIFQPSP